MKERVIRKGIQEVVDLKPYDGLSFASLLSTLRMERGLSIEALADKMGLTPEQVTRYEHGDLKFIYPRTVGRFVTHLGLSMSNPKGRLLFTRAHEERSEYMKARLANSQRPGRA